MFPTTLSSTLVGALLLGSRAQSLPHNPSQQPRVISLPLEVRESPAASLEKRQKAIGFSDLSDSELSKLASEVDIAVKIKIPARPRKKSLWRWTLAAKALRGVCRAYGQIDVEKSKSLRKKDFDPPKPIPYDDQSKVTVENYMNFVSVGNGLDIPDQIFGVAKTSEGLHAGILGLSLSRDLAEFSVLKSLKKNKVISKEAFSIDFGSLNPAGRGKGSVVFGGIDAGRFRGKLQKLKLQSEEEFYITLDSSVLSVPQGKAQITGKPLPVLVDSGANVNYFPRGLMDSWFGPMFKGRVNEKGNYVVRCVVGGLPEASIDFQFGETVISTSLKSLVANPLNKSGPNDECYFRIQPSDDNMDFSLGLPFLESAYTVFDLEAKEMHVAPAAFCDSHLVEMKGNDISTEVGCP